MTTSPEKRINQPVPIEAQVNLTPVYAAFIKLKELKIPLDEIPNDEEECIGCHVGKSVRRVVGYSYDYLTTPYGDPGNTRITIEKGLPGYACNNCNAEAYHNKVLDQFYGVLADAFASAGDNRLKQEREERKIRNQTHSSNATVLGPGETIPINPQTQ